LWQGLYAGRCHLRSIWSYKLRQHSKSCVPGQAFHNGRCPFLCPDRGIVSYANKILSIGLKSCRSAFWNRIRSDTRFAVGCGSRISKAYKLFASAASMRTRYLIETRKAFYARLSLRNNARNYASCISKRIPFS
jgi:uncharacterized Fe-S cluster protein YjdI